MQFVQHAVCENNLFITQLVEMAVGCITILWAQTYLNSIFLNAVSIEMLFSTHPASWCFVGIHQRGPNRRLLRHATCVSTFKNAHVRLLHRAPRTIQTPMKQDLLQSAGHVSNVNAAISVRQLDVIVESRISFVQNYVVVNWIARTKLLKIVSGHCLSFSFNIFLTGDHVITISLTEV
jgi:hypothetical protein